MSQPHKVILRLLIGLPRAIVGLLIGWLVELIRWLRRLYVSCKRRAEIGKGERGKSRTKCMPISDKVYRRPDPLIYSQSYLKAQGLAVTWNNPDIQLYLNGAPVSSTSLKPDTDYEIVATIWNGSTNAPALYMPVVFSYLDFGIATPRVPIGETQVNLPVKGAPGHPASGHMLWHTPSKPGTYCLLVELVWGDDANPNNNVGQENTIVKALNSPHARFQFPLRNNGQRGGVLRLEADAYTLPPPPSCKGQQPAKTPELTKDEIAAKKAEALARHGSANFPIPPGWSLVVSPQQAELVPGDQQLITVDITAPDNFTGQKAFNINAFDEGNNLVGGVTLYVEG